MRASADATVKVMNAVSQKCLFRNGRRPHLSQHAAGRLCHALVNVFSGVGVGEDGLMPRPVDAAVPGEDLGTTTGGHRPPRAVDERPVPAGGAADQNEPKLSHHRASSVTTARSLAESPAGHRIGPIRSRRQSRAGLQALRAVPRQSRPNAARLADQRAERRTGVRDRALARRPGNADADVAAQRRGRPPLWNYGRAPDGPAP